jgi:hypothetical protein
MMNTSFTTTRPTALALLLAVSLGAYACGDETTAAAGSGECPGTTAGSGGGAGSGGATSTSATTSSATTSTTTSTGSGTEAGESGNNSFDHMNDPGESGQKDPFEILKERADEGPPEIRTRLHGCTKIRYAALGDLLSSRGVNLAATAGTGQPKTAGQLYTQGKDALGFAKLDAREAETFFHTTSGATKLFDIFVQAAPEIIANIQNAEACKVGGVGAPMFNADDTCNAQALTCLMGRPPKDQDLVLCNLMVAQNDGTQADRDRKKQVTVAAFLSAAHTCE